MHAIIDPAEIAKPNQNEKRVLRLQVRMWGKQFAVRLKANARRMTQFLHSDR